MRAGSKLLDAFLYISKYHFVFGHVSLYPVPFNITLESLNSYATDGAITIIAVRLRITPKKVKNVERILLFIFYPLINTTAIRDIQVYILHNKWPIGLSLIQDLSACGLNKIYE
jgi:hypothetical protein